MSNIDFDKIPVIDFNDIQGMLDTRTAMKFAYGILWATWGDANTAATIARHVLLTQLSKKEQAAGIEWANKILTRTDEG